MVPVYSLGYGSRALHSRYPTTQWRWRLRLVPAAATRCPWRLPSHSHQWGDPAIVTSNIVVSVYSKILPYRQNHWNRNVILTKFSSLAALEVVILTTSSAVSDENFIKMMTFPFQWCWCQQQIWRAWICNYIPQYSMGCSCLPTPYLPFFAESPPNVKKVG